MKTETFIRVETFAKIELLFDNFVSRNLLNWMPCKKVLMIISNEY
jgi:hypothetical protein